MRKTLNIWEGSTYSIYFNSRVVAYNKRHLAQESKLMDKPDYENSKSFISLMNWYTPVILRWPVGVTIPWKQCLREERSHLQNRNLRRNANRQKKRKQNQRQERKRKRKRRLMSRARKARKRITKMARFEGRKPQEAEQREKRKLKPRLRKAFRQRSPNRRNERFQEDRYVRSCAQWVEIIEKGGVENVQNWVLLQRISAIRVDRGD